MSPVSDEEPKQKQGARNIEEEDQDSPARHVWLVSGGSGIDCGAIGSLRSRDCRVDGVDWKGVGGTHRCNEDADEDG